MNPQGATYLLLIPTSVLQRNPDTCCLKPRSAGCVGLQALGSIRYVVGIGLPESASGAGIKGGSCGEIGRRARGADILDTPGGGGQLYRDGHRMVGLLPLWHGGGARLPC